LCTALEFIKVYVEEGVNNSFTTSSSGRNHLFLAKIYPCLVNVIFYASSVWKNFASKLDNFILEERL
jgi:oligoribonuclease (3'-5' exoribonuclease)